MPSPLEGLFDLECTLGPEQQARMPDAVCRALGVAPGDRLRFRIERDGRVLVERTGQASAPARQDLQPLLGLVAGLMAQQAGAPAALQALEPGVRESLQDLLQKSGAAAPPPDDAHRGRTLK